MRTNGFLRFTCAFIVAGCVASTASAAPVKERPMQPRTEAINFVPPPANDDCAAAIQISSIRSTSTVSTVGASDEIGEPAWTCGPGMNSVWYKIGPFATAQAVSLDTFGSDFDTMLQVLTGACGAQTVIACNDDSNDTVQSHIVFQAAPATVYYIQLAGFSVSTGNAILSANAGVPVPTLGPLGMAALGLLLAGAAILVLRLKN
jgi:hypothetical protein